MGRNADGLELMIEHGMTAVQAIQAATVNAADLLGLSKEVGSIEPGKTATSSPSAAIRWPT